jgi:hypothetical protein
MAGGHTNATGGIDEEQAAGGPLDIIDTIDEDVVDMVDQDWYVLRARSGGGQWLATNAPVEVLD